MDPLVDARPMAPEALARVVAESFLDDPLYRFLSGARGSRHRRNVEALARALIEIHRAGRGPQLGVVRGGELVGVALVLEVGERASWSRFGRSMLALALRAGAPLAWRTVRHLARGNARRPTAPHLYLLTLGVDPKFQGAGCARRLMDAVHAASESHPTSTGVALATENPQSVRFYERLGYSVTGRAEAGGCPSWTMFRSNRKAR